MRKLFVRQPAACAGSLRFALAVALFFLVLIFRVPANAQVTIAQLSDTHLGEANSPHAAENLRRAVDMINDRHPDAVVLSGDIGENPEEWQRARQILKGLKAPIYYAPGNHDVHSNDIAQYRRVFGPDYYSFHVKGVTFLVIDSQLFGNYDQFGLQPLAPLSSQNQAEAEKMLAWLANPDLRQDGDNQGAHGDAAKIDRKITTAKITTAKAAMAITAEKLLSASSTFLSSGRKILFLIPSLTGSSMSRTAHAKWPCCTNSESNICSSVIGMWAAFLRKTELPGTLRPVPAGCFHGADSLALLCIPSAATAM